jgi:hypothetical protein
MSTLCLIISDATTNASIVLYLLKRFPLRFRACYNVFMPQY